MTLVKKSRSDEMMVVFCQLVHYSNDTFGLDLAQIWDGYFTKLQVLEHIRYSLDMVCLRVESLELIQYVKVLVEILRQLYIQVSYLIRKYLGKQHIAQGYDTEGPIL